MGAKCQCSSEIHIFMNKENSLDNNLSPKIACDIQGKCQLQKNHFSIWAGTL